MLPNGNVIADTYAYESNRLGQYIGDSTTTPTIDYGQNS